MPRIFWTGFVLLFSLSTTLVRGIHASEIHAAASASPPNAASSSAVDDEETLPVGLAEEYEAAASLAAKAQETDAEAEANDGADQVNILILDWDDTLLCSTDLSKKKLRLDSTLKKDCVKELRTYGRVVIEFLDTALRKKFDKIVLITNARSAWVEFSSYKFIPAIYHKYHFKDKDKRPIEIMSARSTYEAVLPGGILQWKYYAMRDTLNHYWTADEFKDKRKNIMSYGDSYIEREAVRTLTRGRANTYTKSIKFAERPNMEQLRRQLELAKSTFRYVYNHPGDLDLQLTVKAL